MRQIKRLKAFVCALAGTALLSACSSEADEIINEAGKGYVSLSVQADAGFQTTRAASEEAYEDVNNYTVQIWKGEDLFNEYKPNLFAKGAYKSIVSFEIAICLSLLKCFKVLIL